MGIVRELNGEPRPVNAANHTMLRVHYLVMVDEPVADEAARLLADRASARRA